MKLHRFLYNFETGAQEISITDPEMVAQMVKVLRLKVGEWVVLSNGNSHEVVGEILDMKKGAVNLKVVEERKNESEPQMAVTLYCAILKRENFEWVVQKATEIGVKEIVPIITKRTVKLNLNQARLEKIIKEAAEQSGRGMVPVLREPVKFEEVVLQAKGKNILFDASGDEPVLPAEKQTQKLESLSLFIGPEGGWDPSEIELAKNAGFQIAALGKLTLRAETAAIVATYLATRE